MVIIIGIGGMAILIIFLLLRLKINYFFYLIIIYIIGGIIGLISGFIGSAIITALIDNPKIKQKGIKVDNNSTLKKHPLLIERFKDGWTFDKPTA